MIEQVLGHDVELGIESDDVVLDVIVLARAQNAEGDEAYGVMGMTDHTDPIVQMGLLHHAQAALDSMRWNGS